MRTAPRPPSLDDGTIEYFEPPPPPDQGILPAFKGRRDDVTPTSRGLGGAQEGGEPRRSKEERAEMRWLALVEHGLVDRGTRFVLLQGAEEACAQRGDEVEGYVVREVESGTTLRRLLETGPYSERDVVR
ncbi:MAG TPA: hypothetical protein VGI39_31220, partial [Polyangiaceae bacterium]